MSSLEIILVVMLSLGLITTLIFLGIMIKRNKGNKDSVPTISQENFLAFKDNTQESLNAFKENTQESLKTLKNSLLESVQLYNKSISEKIQDNNLFQRERYENLDKLFVRLKQEMTERLEKISSVVDGNLETMTKSNEKKLDEMRVIVDEKLQSTLNDRFAQSFKIVDEKLLEMTSKLGEMKHLTTGVNDLRRILTNIKTRGVFGEVQLANILEQMLNPEQYETQFTISKGNIVDFAIKMPGKKNNTIYLPIDAKFPIENYQRLQNAIDEGDKTTIELESKNLEKVIKTEAKSISKKYISVPDTTDFAIMFLPIESLYGEVLRRPGLAEELQRDYKIMVCGPTTIIAILNCLQMGFNSLNIEKRSSEIAKLLNSFRKDFATFAGLLGKTKKKIDEAGNTLEDVTKRTNIINKNLDKISNIDFDFKENNVINIETVEEIEDVEETSIED